MKMLNVTITSNKKITPYIYKMRIKSEYLAKHISPGQFVEVRCSNGTNPLLRRPFSVHRILSDSIEILYETVGKGTELLSRKKPGDVLDVIGPLGNGFGLRNTKYERRTTILIAGGMGVAPLVALAETIVQRTAYSVQREKLCVLIGAKKKEDVLCVRDFKKLGVKVFITTDDGSKGGKGLVTDFLNKVLRNTHYAIRDTQIYACGPIPMLKATAAIAKAHNIPCQVSLEERIACGVGVCLGCPVRIVTSHKSQVTSSEYKMICKDGPIFNAREIAW